MLPKNQFLEKSDPLTEQFQNFTMKGFTGSWIYVFLLSFAEVGKAEVTKRVHGIYHEKILVFCPFLCGFWSDLAKHFTCRIILSPFPIPLSSFVQIRPVFEETYDIYIQKCLPDSFIQYRCEACMLLADNIGTVVNASTV